MNDRRIRVVANLAAERWRFSLWLTVAMMVIYFGFVLLIAYNKPLLGKLIAPGLSLGILLGALVIVAAWALIYIYVRWSNNYFDKKISSIRAEQQIEQQIEQ
jgi:uncharacterized membrane protein (DUF485 family)